MNWSEVVQLIQSGDSVSVKFVKRSDDIERISQIIAAFANTIGGHLIIGIDRANFHFTGSSLTEAELSAFANGIYPAVKYSLHEIVKGDKRIHVIEVKMGDNPPYSYNKFVYSLDVNRPWVFKMNEEPSPVPTAVETHLSVEAVKEVPEAEISVSEGVNEAMQPALHLFDSIPLNSRQEGALSYLKTHSMIQNKVYRELFNVSHKTAHIELTNLTERELLVQKGSGRSTHYILSQSLRTGA